jgi:hypothetical protein
MLGETGMVLFGLSNEGSAWFFSLIISLIVGVGVGIAVKAWQGLVFGFLGMLMVFTLIGFLPAWFLVVLIIIAGVILARTVGEYFGGTK